jgi:hypothetical protein
MSIDDPPPEKLPSPQPSDADYARMIRQVVPPERDAEYGKMLWYFTPATLFSMALVGFWFINWKMYPQGDSRDFGSPCCMIVMGPAALACLPLLATEAMRPRGLRVLFRSILCCLLLPLGIWLGLWLIIKLQLFKHGW